MTTKILALTDALGNLVRFRLIPEQNASTVWTVSPLIDGLNNLIKDRPFDQFRPSSSKPISKPTKWDAAGRP
ncbi:hypothetical protein [Acetobacter pasteurianus]|uniref:hypothetical protein n=1 Tax=Acetobacter pasteurianus TaxID=438 RepID=UPI001178877B|nr:hypothetical protein [Acetobacter pasteurianus]